MIVERTWVRIQTAADLQRTVLLLSLASSFRPPPPLIFWFPNLFRHVVGLLGRVISSSQGLYVHRTTQHREPRTNIHALSGDSKPRPRVRAIKARASHRAATGSTQCIVTVG
jgi:hypothetical protein